MARNSLLKNYHRLAEDALLGDRSSSDDPIISAATNGQWERVESILDQHRSSVDARERDTGDTPLIAAARNGHANVVKVLLKYGADVTLQNDQGETALEVASDDMKKLILSSVTHEGRTMSTAQALLQSAWLGDSVSVKKHLSGSHYIDVNCQNSDGLTPMLLVTRDIALFEKVHNAMTTEYNPVKVLEDLIENQADINVCDKQGRSALHLVATSNSIHAKRMVSLLVKQGSNADSMDSKTLAPLHVASSQGHMSIIVALVEEGGADINSRGGDQKDTPLILTARSGHNEAAKYLLTKGADITLVNEHGDTALSVAKTQSMVQILKEAWTERAQVDKRGKEAGQVEEDRIGGSPTGSSPASPMSPRQKSCFLTEHQMTKSYEYEDSDYTDNETLRGDKLHHGSFPGLLPACSEAEADDEFEYDSSRRRLRHAKHRAQIRATFEGSVTKRKQERKDLVESPRKSSGDWKSKSLPKHYKDPEYSSIDDDFIQRMSDNGPGDEEQVKPTTDLLGDEQRREVTNRREEPMRGEGQRGKEQALKEVGPLREVGPPKEVGRGGVKEEELHTRKDQKKGGVTQPKGLLGRLSKHLLGGLHDRSHSQDSLHTTGLGEETKKTILLPSGVPGMKAPAAGKHKDLLAVKRSSMEHLPVLSQMQPVALVSVEVDRQRLHVQQFGPKDGRGHTHQTMTRSQSLSVVKPGTEHQGGGDGAHKKRNSTGSVLLGPELEKAHGVRVPLLPSVVAPHFEPHHTSQKPKARGRLQPLSLTQASVTPHTNLTPHTIITTHTNLTPPHLSIVNEDSEGSSSDRTLTSEPKRSNPKLKPSEGEVTRRQGSEATPTIITSPVQKSPMSNNTLVHFAEANGSIPLSPIWNQMQYLRTDSETSSNSEYIHSYIGHDHPPQTPDPTERKPGVDSGHGESDEEQVASEGSEGEGLQMGDKEVLKWKRGRLLGRGAYGKVWEGLMDSAKMVAVKEVELDSDPERAQAQFEKIQVEVDILRSLRHKNIVSYLGTSMHGSVVYIFMDFISGGSLQSILKRFGQLDEKTISHYTRQIVKGLDYLHSNAIVHRDIKGANIMVTSRGIIKMIDFGCAKKYCQEMSGEMHSVRGTPYWMAPEVICGQGYGRKSDIWSLGCTVHEMGTTKPPWAELPPESALFNIGLGTAVCIPPDHFSPDLRDFVFSKCLTRDQTLRPSAHELLEHRFLLMAKSCGPKQH